MRIRPIRTEDDYDKAIEEISRLWKFEFSSPEFDELEVLSILVHYYEGGKEQFISNPVDAIKFRMEQQELTKMDLLPALGTIERVEEILDGSPPTLDEI